MLRSMLFVGLMAISGSAVAGPPTDWGIRAVPGSSGGPKLVVAPGEKILVPPKTPYRDPSLPPESVPQASGFARVDMSKVSGIGSRWGRVTSTLRSVAHNRAVGGMPNSYHLSGRAIDIARRPGVSHWQIAAALRAAGYNLLESLDEGDHSHFAFGNPGEVKYRRAIPISARAKIVIAQNQGQTVWRIVYAPSGGGK
nr:D-Ala-D-Ala carboxypeptidase family metallohydrolase [uncultured Sphingomonas sp.]